MSGVTHNRALGEEAPLLIEPTEPTRQSDRTAELMADVRHERQIYVVGLGREKIKKSDRLAWQKKAQELTTTLLKLELGIRS